MTSPRTGGIVAGRYRLEAVMGEGGLGVVYEATPLGGGTSVAIKLLSSQWTDDERKRKRFKREGEILARLKHANILRLHEVGVTDEGQPFLVTELVHGRTLKEVAATWPHPPAFLHSVALQLRRRSGFSNVEISALQHIITARQVKLPTIKLKMSSLLDAKKKVELEHDERCVYQAPWCCRPCGSCGWGALAWATSYTSCCPCLDSVLCLD